MTALHITTDRDITSIEADKFYQDSFTPILRTAEELKQPLDTAYIVADEVESTILNKLTSERYNLLIVGAGVRLSSEEDDREASTMRQHLSRVMGALPMRTTESLLSIHSMLRDKMAFFVHRAPCSVGILLSRSSDSPKHILVYVHSASDLRLLPYARTMAENNQAHLRIALSSGMLAKALLLTLEKSLYSVISPPLYPVNATLWSLAILIGKKPSIPAKSTLRSFLPL